MNVRLAFASACAALVLFAGCATTAPGTRNYLQTDKELGYSTAPKSAAELNANPPPYWIGHRVYAEKRVTWGYIRRPDEGWSQSRLVLMREDRSLAPHRKLGSRDADHNHEYRLYGRYWHRKGYEPVINRLLDVFELERYEPLGPAPEIPVKNPPVAITFSGGGPTRLGRDLGDDDDDEPAPRRRRASYEAIE